MDHPLRPHRRRHRARVDGGAEHRESDPRARRDLRVAIGVNLVLNVLWTWLFFAWKRPRLALAEILLLEVSTIDLIRRCSRYDATSGRLLTPYAAWVAFATALTAELVRRNPRA